MKNLFLFVSLTLISCSKDSPNNKVADNFDTKIDICLVDNSGNYLINNSIYPFNSVSVKYLVNNSIINPPYQGSQPILSDDSLPKRIRFFLNNDSSEEYPITYVYWNTADTDTIKAHFSRGNSNGQNYVVLDKVWYNNKLINPTDYINPGYYIKIIK